MNNASDLIRIEAVAKRLDVSPQLVYRLASKGVLRGVKIGGRWRFEPKEIDAFIQRQRHQPPPKAHVLPTPQELRRASRAARLDLPGADYYLKPRRRVS